MRPDTVQTYVDAIRKNGILDKDAQTAAMGKSLEKACLLLSETAVTALDEIYGDGGEYLTSRIEAEVKRHKVLPANE